MATETSGIHMWLVLWKAYDACQAAAQRSIESLGICYSDFAVLECLLHKGPLPVNTIGAKVSLTSGSITTAVDRLADKGLVKRRDSESDRRSRVVHLTKAGRKLIECEFEKHRKDMERHAQSLSTDERKQLVNLLRRFGKQVAASAIK